MDQINVLDLLPNKKVVIVTGGYGHLGKAISASLANYGAIVYVAARNEKEFQNKFALELSSKEKQLHFLYCDISSSESFKNAFAKVIEEEGKIDGLINNAFGQSGQSPYSMSREDFNYTLDKSVASVFDAIKIAIPQLREGASIINVSSIYGFVAPDFKIYRDCPEYLNPPHYGAAKAGVIQLGKYYASLLGPKGIRVNTISPGPFPSDSVQDNTKFINELKERTLLGRYGSSEDVAGIFTFLMSDAARFITGQNFIIDGGWTVR